MHEHFGRDKPQVRTTHLLPGFDKFSAHIVSTVASVSNAWAVTRTEYSRSDYSMWYIPLLTHIDSVGSVR